MAGTLQVESTRGDVVESVHRVSLAVVDRDGRLVMSAGNPDLLTFWRSAAKPFQAMPLIASGAADRYGFTSRELALACASHSSEPVHLEIAEGMLRKIGLPESALACGIHPPISPAVAEQVVRQGTVMTPRWSNCSGKHAGMLATAAHQGWPLAGYNEFSHPLQQQILAEITRWSDCPADRMAFAVDGCAAVCFGLPLRAMALAYARLGVSAEPAATRLRQAMAGHPELVAGQGRLCTDLGVATAGAAVAKVGADGIYCAALTAAGLGLALKVEDGDMLSSGPALLFVLAALAGRHSLGFDPGALPAAVTRHAAIPIVNTRGTRTGSLQAVGRPRFVA
ncbi:MAG: asparaginase [Gemmatimonadota bacterium]|nr:asparaginase [Gemmatimonadota bacterium]